MLKRILLVEPAFPISKKSRNHHNFLPIGLLKIGAALRSSGHKVKLVRGTPDTIDRIAELAVFSPDEVWITSLFTYWAQQVIDTARAYREQFPNAPITVGGIFSSLLGKNAVRELTGCERVHVGLYWDAENVEPAYDLLEPNGIDYQIIHASRGCSRRCSFCGTWKIEQEISHLHSVQKLITKKKLVFYDNNFLDNPHIENILGELAELRAARRILWCESQSGFDGRILAEKPALAALLRQAGFQYPRIAWDGRLRDKPSIRAQIDLLQGVGYQAHRDIYVFMLSNWDVPFDEMEAKRISCWEWGVQIADCRYRPLNQLYDRFSASLAQTSDDYYIHVQGAWTDQRIKQFRKNIREQNICVRHGFRYYSRALERSRQPLSQVGPIRRLDFAEARAQGLDPWYPGEVRPPWSCPAPVDCGSSSPLLVRSLDVTPPFSSRTRRGGGTPAPSVSASGCRNPR